MGRNYKYKTSIPYSFTYGYAITCHKAQGSEWDNVLVIEEGFPFDKEEHKRWLYTAATRAAKKLVIIRK
jgi:exodeoxyribonuclease-5